MTNLPKAPGSLPLVGHAVSLWRDPLGFLSSLPSYGDLVQIRVGPQAIVMACDPTLTRQILLDDRTFDKGGPIFDRGRDVLGNGLVTCKHSEHRRQRRLTQPSFQHSRIGQYAEIMAKHIDEVTASWQNRSTIDVLSSLKNIAARIIVETVFTSALSPRALDEVVRDFTAFSAGVYTRMFLPPSLSGLPTRSNRSYELARTRMRQKVSNVIAEKRKSLDGGDDLLSVLLEAYNNDEYALSEAELNDQVMTFFFGGIETTAIALGWALHLIAQHPHAEERLFDEVDTVLAGRPASLEDLPDLGFTRSVITETLRLYPPTWLVTRATSRDTELGGHKIAENTVVAYSPYILHHRRDLHPDPDRFNPDRWGEGAPPRDSMLPFGGGARKCIGDNFAVTEATLMLATIAARWRLEMVSGHRVRPAPRAFLIPRGLIMRTASRTNPTDGTTP